MKDQGTRQFFSRRSRRAVLLMSAVAGFLLAGAAFSASAADAAMTDYTRWIKPWSEHTNTSSRLSAELKVIVTIVTGEKPLSVVTNLTPVERLNLAYHLKTTGTEVTTNGACWSYYASNLAAKEAPIRWFSPDELKQLDDLLTHLPDDGSALPPPGQRIVVQVWEQDHWRVRVYDRAGAPPEVQSVLNFIGNPFDKSL